jgi:plasmid stability protein
MPVNLLIENAPDDVVDRLRQRAKLRRRSLEGELLAIIESAVLDERRSTATPGFAEEDQVEYRAPHGASQLDEVLDQVRTLSDDRRQEVAQLLRAYLEEEESDFGLSPEQIVEIERRMADDGPYATDEEVWEVFARLTK